MSPRTATRLARALAGLGVLLVPCGLVVSAGTASGSDIGTEGFISVLALAFSLLGALIAFRQPSNAIGWIFLGMAVATGFGAVTGAYAVYWADGNGGWAALGEAAAWYSNLSWIPFILIPPSFLLLLFPDGHLLSPRGRPVAWCVALGIGGTFITEGLQPGPDSGLSTTNEPVRGGKPTARSVSGPSVPGHPGWHPRFRCIAHHQVSPRQGEATSTDQVAGHTPARLPLWSSPEQAPATTSGARPSPTQRACLAF